MKWCFRFCSCILNTAGIHKIPVIESFLHLFIGVAAVDKSGNAAFRPHAAMPPAPSVKHKTSENGIDGDKQRDAKCRNLPKAVRGEGKEAVDSGHQQLEHAAVKPPHKRHF